MQYQWGCSPLREEPQEGLRWYAFPSIAQNNSILVLNVHLPLSKIRNGLTFLGKYILRHTFLIKEFNNIFCYWSRFPTNTPLLASLPLQESYSFLPYLFFSSWEAFWKTFSILLHCHWCFSNTYKETFWVAPWWPEPKFGSGLKRLKI